VLQWQVGWEGTLQNSLELLLEKKKEKKKGGGG